MNNLIKIFTLLTAMITSPDAGVQDKSSDRQMYILNRETPSIYRIVGNENEYFLRTDYCAYISGYAWINWVSPSSSENKIIWLEPNGKKPNAYRSDCRIFNIFIDVKVPKF